MKKIPQSLLIINNQVGLRDHISEGEYQGKSFRDLGDYLYEKHEDRVKELLEELENAIDLEERMKFFKFEYNDETGSRVTISQDEKVEDIVSITDTVFWYIGPMGG